MKTVKIPVVLLLAVLLVFGMAAAAYAAPNDDVIQALKDAKVPATYIIQAENYLKTRELTQAESNAVVAQIEKASDIMENADVKSLTKLSNADRQAILAAASEAGDAIGITVSVEKNANGSYTIIGVDNTGKEVVNFTSTEVKQTGADLTPLFLGAALVLAAIGSAFAVKRYHFNGQPQNQ